MSSQNNLLRETPAVVLSAVMLVVLPAGNVLAQTTFGSESKPPIADWRSLESGHYQTYVKNLQAIGCPPQTIHAIVTADVISAFSDTRSEALAARYQNFQYWKSNPSEMKAATGFTARRRALDAKMSNVLQFLLGADTDLPDFSRLWKQEELECELAFLTPEKRGATKAVLLKYAGVNEKMKELSAGLFLTQDTNALRQILAGYKEEQATLQQFLSAVEYQQVEMTVSWTAANLRHAMVHFDPTREEFGAIFEAWRPHDEALARIYANRQTDPGNARVYAKIKSRLSAARYKEYCDTWWK